MNLLVANLGSTSFKYRLFRFTGAEEAVLLAKGGAERVSDYGVAIDACLAELRAGGHLGAGGAHQHADQQRARLRSLRGIGPHARDRGVSPPPALRPAGSVRIVSYANTEVVLEVDSPEGGWVVLNDVWHPRWEVEVDGRDIGQAQLPAKRTKALRQMAAKRTRSAGE
jgi:hypothetical protein